MKAALRLTLLASAVLLRFDSLQAGDGAFDTPSRSCHTGDQVIAEAHRPEALAAVDIDGDGDVDAVLAHRGNFIAPRFNVMRNDGAGGFAAPEVYAISGTTSGIVAADLDGDGDADLAFTQSDVGVSGERACVFLNDGNGTFGPESSYVTGKGPWGIAAFDADSDGNLDLGTANWFWGESDVSVLYNDGAAHFTQRADFPVPGTQPIRLFAGDLSGDGWQDLVVTIRGAQPAIFVLANDGSGGFGAAVPYSSGFQSGSELSSAAIVDVDLDGDLDVLCGRDEDQGSVGTSIGLFRNLGGGQLAPSQAIPTTGAFGTVWNFAIADVTQDGWPDILGTGYSSKYGWDLIPSTGGGNFGPPTAFRTGEDAHDIAVADADADGDLDVLVADSGSLGLTIHLNAGGVFSMPPLWLVPGGAGEIAAADLELDGDLDLVTVASWIMTLRNDGAADFAVETFNAGIGIQKRVRLADVDGDGFADALTLDADTNTPYQFHVLRNTGSGSFGPATTYLIGSCGPGDLVPVDFDGDRDLDVVITEYLGCGGGGNANKLFFFRNDGAGNSTALPPFTSFAITKAERIQAADPDHDGDADLVTTHPETVAVWKGHGDGTFELGVEYDLGEWGPST